MRRSVVSVALLALFSMGTGCRDITDGDLVGRFLLQRNTVRLELRLNADHTFAETITEAGVSRTETGTWGYSFGTRDLNLIEAWVPVAPFGSKRVQLKKTPSSLNVERCGVTTVCLVVSDDDQLEFRKQ
jgi:hypothetical protein